MNKYMEEYIIKECDLKKFSKICGELEQLIQKIRKYEPSAHLYATPDQMNLMVGYGSCVGRGKREKHGDERKILDSTILYMDVGDW